MLLDPICYGEYVIVEVQIETLRLASGRVADLQPHCVVWRKQPRRRLRQEIASDVARARACETAIGFARDSKLFRRLIVKTICADKPLDDAGTNRDRCQRRRRVSVCP